MYATGGSTKRTTGTPRNNALRSRLPIRCSIATVHDMINDSNVRGNTTGVVIIDLSKICLRS